MTENPPESASTPPPQHFALELPSELDAGVPADFASLWHTPTTFIIDFVVMKAPAQQGMDDDGNPVVVIPTKVVSRVRIPPEQVFELARALTQQLTAWEIETGQRKPDEGIPGTGAPPGMA